SDPGPEALPPRGPRATEGSVPRTETGRRVRAGGGEGHGRPGRGLAADGPAGRPHRDLAAGLFVRGGRAGPRHPALDRPRPGDAGAHRVAQGHRRRTMIDERDALERAIRQFAPEPGMEDRVHRRLRRRQRSRRIGTAVLSLVVAAIGLAMLLKVTPSGSPTPATTTSAPTPSVASSLPPRVPMHNGSLDVFGFVGGVRTYDEGGIGPFEVKCHGGCTEIDAAAWSPDGTTLAFTPSCGGGCGSAGDPYHGLRI